MEAELTKKETLVTIILTVYKRTEYLEIALKSVLTQTMGQFEIIIADDSGLRLAEPIYMRYKDDKRIIYQPNLKTIGIVNSIKSAVEKGRGDFISILNDDDCWEDDFLEKLTDALGKDKDRVLAFSDHWIINDLGEIDNLATELNTKTYKRESLLTGEITDPSKMVLLDNGIPLAMASVFRKDAISWDMLTNDVSGAYDFWISCLLASTGKQFYYVSNRLTRYRLHSQMETGRRSVDKQLNMIYIMDTLLKLNLFPAYKKFLIKKKSFFLYRVGRDNLYFENTGTARNFFKKSIEQSISYRPAVAFMLSYLPAKILKRIPF